MTLRPTTLAAGLLLGPLTVLALATPALAVCDAYSGTCTEPTEVLPTAQDAPTSTPGTSTTGSATGATAGAPTVTTRGAVTPSTLPFTGGELVLVTALGATAVAGGAALVVAGRRRATDAA